MKIYLVTMKQVPNNAVGYRLKAMKAEAAAKEAGLELPPREHNWYKQEDDEKAIRDWREALEARKSLLNGIGIVIPQSKASDEENEYKINQPYEAPTFACTSDQLLQILEVDDSITIKSSAPVASDSFTGLLSRMDEVVRKLENVDIPDPADPPAHVFNEHCEVHLPGNLLATYNESLLLEDSCTDELQKALNKGWRIIAVCPQSQRRPDYILGRYNPDLDTAWEAKRKP